jgi:hypothetical protein
VSLPTDTLYYPAKCGPATAAPYRVSGFGVAGIRFRPGNLVAVAVAGNRERVDREHLIPRCHQGLDP